MCGKFLYCDRHIKRFSPNFNPQNCTHKTSVVNNYDFLIEALQKWRKIEPVATVLF